MDQAKTYRVLREHGAWLCWRQVIAAFLISFCTMGLSFSWSEFQSYYKLSTLSSHSAASIYWIDSTQDFLLLAVGGLSGALYDRGLIRALVGYGAMLNVAGLVGASFAGDYAGVLLALGGAVGLGSGLLYVPSIALVASYFTSPLALAISTSGTGVGAILYPLLFRQLLDRAGFGWTCRGLALLNGLLLLLAFLLVRPPWPGCSTSAVPAAAAAPSRPLLEVGMLRSVTFLMFSFALFLEWLGAKVPVTLLQRFVTDQLHMSARTGEVLQGTLHAAGIAGRLLISPIAIQYGPLGIWHFSMVVACLVAAFWPEVGSVTGVVIFVTLYGFFTGVLVSLIGPALLVLFPDRSRVGSRLGLCSAVISLGCLIGQPLTGAIQETTYGYVGQSVFAGSSFLTAFAIMGIVQWRHRRKVEILSGLHLCAHVDHTLARDGQNTVTPSTTIQMKV